MNDMSLIDNGEPTVKVAIRDLYKIFGDDPETALKQVKAGMTKSELLETSNHVLGLRDINIDIHDGQITVIMGLSGSGKSTLIRHLNRLIEPTSGEVLVEGENILDWNEAKLRGLRREAMSMVFQKFALLPHRTVLENAGMALAIEGKRPADYAEKVEYWLERVGLAGFGGHYPNQLSGGMQQRVGIARALASDAGIMLMDEAFSALDPLIRTDMQDLLIELQSELQKTIVFITHDLDEALKLADHLVILKDGEVVQQGEPQEILLNPATDYIRAFVADINRARVLRVRSVMRRGKVSGEIAGNVDPNATLESLIALSEGDHTRRYQVVSGKRVLGVISMHDLLKALVPARPEAGDETLP